MQLLWAALDRLLVAAMRERASRATLLGLRPADVDALRHIVTRGATNPAALADALQMTSGGATAVVDRLEHAGLVGRTSRRRGRRRVLLTATPSGEAAVRNRTDELADDISRLVEADAIQPGGLTQLADAFERQGDRLAAVAAGRTSGRSRVGPRVAWG